MCRSHSEFWLWESSLNFHSVWAKHYAVPNEELREKKRQHFKTNNSHRHKLSHNLRRLAVKRETLMDGVCTQICSYVWVCVFAWITSHNTIHKIRTQNEHIPNIYSEFSAYTNVRINKCVLNLKLLVFFFLCVETKAQQRKERKNEYINHRIVEILLCFGFFPIIKSNILRLSLSLSLTFGFAA